MAPHVKFVGPRRRGPTDRSRDRGTLWVGSGRVGPPPAIGERVCGKRSLTFRGSDWRPYALLQHQRFLARRHGEPAQALAAVFEQSDKFHAPAPLAAL